MIALNEEIADSFTSSFLSYKSSDSSKAGSKAELRYTQELLNSVEAGASLSYHEIKLKKGFIVMLLRNISYLPGMSMERDTQSRL